MNTNEMQIRNRDGRMTRRHFLQAAAGLPLLAAAAPAADLGKGDVTAARLPRWRGFNLTEKITGSRNAPFRESDFEWIAEWGFDFVRLPMSYQCWADAGDWCSRRLTRPLRLAASTACM